jgi:hypothetical protein
MVLSSIPWTAPVQPQMQNDYRPDKFSLSNSEISATGALAGGAVANICREAIKLRQYKIESDLKYRILVTAFVGYLVTMTGCDEGKAADCIASLCAVIQKDIDRHQHSYECIDASGRCRVTGEV